MKRKKGRKKGRGKEKKEEKKDEKKMEEEKEQKIYYKNSEELLILRIFHKDWKNIFI